MVVIIDPGHGGKDPGAVAHGDFEKTYTLLISLYQFARFKELGVPVGITRDKDVDLPNAVRAATVKNSGAKVCISNHLNAGPPNSKSAQGVEVIHGISNNGQLAHKVVDALAAAGIPKRATPVYFKKNSSGGNYYFMHRLTGAVQTNIIEYDFITHPDGIKRIKENWQRYAEAVVKVYTMHLGYTYNPPKAEEPIVKEASGVFKDVPDDHQFKKTLERAYELGITKGVGNGRFGLGQTMSREEGAVMMVRLYDLLKGER